MLNHRVTTSVFGLLMLILLSIHFFSAAISIYYFLIPFGLYLGIVAWGSSQITSNYHLTAHCCAPKNKQNEISLSFDDGPDATFTPIVLDILKKHQVKASFFCIGHKIEGNADLLKRIVEEGHIIGNHSFSHSYLFDFFTASKVKDELAKTNQVVEAITHQKLKFFRPPYGVTTPAIAEATEALKLTTVGWDVRSLDTVEKDSTKITARVIKQLKSGSIILFHDTNNRIESVLEQVIVHCKENGFKIVSLSKLLNLNAYE
ncbi:MAG: polysaccharide deacetylase family protein [Bacteroidetes bacterium]|nr:polysaccharide deacetylase family protein [Bacteroidota bacterium]